MLRIRDFEPRFPVKVRTYSGAATRFLLHTWGYGDTITRFQLTASASRDVSCRFFLYQPTWRDLQIQKEIATLQAEIDGKLGVVTLPL